MTFHGGPKRHYTAGFGGVNEKSMRIKAAGPARRQGGRGATILACLYLQCV